MKELNNLQNYIPDHSSDQIYELIRLYQNLSIKISSGRKSKWGDYRYHPDSKSHRISVNGDLNKYSFLITLLHELAHLEVRLKHGRVKPHGREWKSSFQILLQPFLSPEIFPPKLLLILNQHIKNPRASISADIHLFQELRSFDNLPFQRTISDLPDGTIFRIAGGEAFVKLRKIRKRFECYRLRDRRKYVFSPLVVVSPFDKDKRDINNTFSDS